MSTLSPAQTRAAIRIVIATLVLDILGLGIVIPVLPELVTALSGGDPTAAARWYGPLLAVYALLQFLFAPVLGSLSDRFGRRPVLLASVLVFGLDHLVQYWAPTLAWLFVGRMVAGVAGSSVTTVQAALADLSTPSTRSRNFGLVGAAFGIGFILGPAIGGVLSAWGPRTPFLGAAVLSALNLIVAWRILPETLPQTQRRPFSLREAHPLASLARLRSVPGIAPLVVGLALASFGQRALESVWVLHGTVRYGWTSLENGLTLALVGVLVAISQGGLIRRIVPALGEPRTIRIALVLWALAYLGYGFAAEPVVLFAAMPVSALGALAVPTLQGRVAGMVQPSEQGAVQGGIASILAVVAATSPLVATEVFSRGAEAGWAGAPFFIGTGCFLASLAVVYRALDRPT